MALIRDVFPDFSEELVGLVEASTRPELAAGIPDLPVVDRCRCGQSNCAHFYTAPRPEGAYGPGHESVPLDSEKGWIILDVVGGTVVAVEILDRPDVKRQLDAVLP
jgi:hypothetical protein